MITRRRVMICAMVALVAPAVTMAQHVRTDSADRAARGAAMPRSSAQLDSIRADSVLEARTTRLAVQLRCAVCQGISIQESPSSLAREMREVVKDQLRAGRSDAEVKAYFVSKYGEWILLAPTARGFNLVLYVLPALLLIGGLVGIAVVVRRWTSAPAP
ncbi:MAG: cytochrome c-type biogenesis protein CcmH [Gemmatimonadaceae bacterium]|nr:cytochrome c-type biogenesis protein CcmH [Gemmatimonadaceae bacterium]